jgi:hypothetical protein
MKDTKQALTPRISIAVRAWSEEAAIRAALDSLFQQSLFEALSKLFNRADTLANRHAARLNNPRACIASVRQHKDIGCKNKKSLRDRMSLATSDMARTIDGQITGQA